MRSLMKTLMALSVACLMGCGTQQPAVSYKTIAVLPDDALLMDCAIAPPPDAATYKAADTGMREELLMDNIHAHLKNGFVCNSRWDELRKWKKAQKALYHSPLVD